MTSLELVKSKAVPASEAVKLIRSNDTIFIGLTSNHTVDLCEALYARKDELENVTLLSSMIMRPTSVYTGKGAAKAFNMLTPFIGPIEKLAVKNGLPSDFTSCHLSQLDYWFRETARPNVAFMAVSMPDEDGFVSFGPSGYAVYTTMLEVVDRIVLEIIPDMPYVNGSMKFNINQADAIVLSTASMPIVPNPPADEMSLTIAGNILDLIPDGATIQLGLGGLSSAIGKGLKSKNDLGIYTEFFTQPMVDLIKSGNVTNKKKGFMDGKTVFAFSFGDRELYDLMDHNDEFYSADFPFVNDARNICKNKNMISINTAMSINLYGEVAAEAVGYSQYSAVGGQIDFVKGSQWSEGGKSIIAMESTYRDKTGSHSKIVLNFAKGTPVTTPRSEVQYIATEYGCVNLKALRMRDRVRAMISLAHPDFRDELTEQAKAAGIW